MIRFYVTLILGDNVLSLSSSLLLALQHNLRTSSQEIHVLVPSSTNQICDVSYFNSLVLSILVVSNSVLSLSLSIYLLLPALIFFPNHLLSSYLLFLFQFSVSFSQLLHILSSTASLGFIILQSSIPCGQKTLKDCIFGPNPNLYCLDLGRNTPFSVLYKQGLCPGWITFGV